MNVSEVIVLNLFFQIPLIGSYTYAMLILLGYNIHENEIKKLPLFLSFTPLKIIANLFGIITITDSRLAFKQSPRIFAFFLLFTTVIIFYPYINLLINLNKFTNAVIVSFEFILYQIYMTGSYIKLRQG